MAALDADPFWDQVRKVDAVTVMALAVTMGLASLLVLWCRWYTWPLRWRRPPWRW